MPNTDLLEFKNWLMTVAPHDLERWLLDAYWQGHLEGSELERAYLLSHKNVDMRTTPIKLG